jgi:hypothetical protein
MHAPVSMLKGMGGKGSTSMVLVLLFGLAVVAMVNKATPSTPQARKPNA